MSKPLRPPPPPLPRRASERPLRLPPPPPPRRAMRPPPLPADLAPPPPVGEIGTPYQALPPPMHTSTMPSEAPTAQTVRPPVEIEVVREARPSRSRPALWALAAGATGFALGLVAQIPLMRDQVAPAAAERVGSTVLDAAESAELASAADLADAQMTDSERDEAELALAEEEAGAADVEVPDVDAARATDAPATTYVANPAPVATSEVAAPPPRPAAATPQPAAAPPQAPRASTTTRSDASDPYAEGARPSPGSAPPGASSFDRGAASAALGTATSAASACRGADGPTGVAQVTVTFAPSGRVTQAVVNGAPYAGTATGSCIAQAFRGTSVPAFTGEPVTVSKTVTIR